MCLLSSLELFYLILHLSHGFNHRFQKRFYFGSFGSFSSFSLGFSLFFSVFRNGARILMAISFLSSPVHLLLFPVLLLGGILQRKETHKTVNSFTRTALRQWHSQLTKFCSPQTYLNYTAQCKLFKYLSTSCSPSP